MKKSLVAIAVLVLAAHGFAQTGKTVLSATFMEIAGKVEYKVPDGAWKPAKAGIVIGKGTVVSTGFKSTAVLKAGTATITVKPVTRLSIEEIVKTEGGTTTTLFLTAGRVKAEVTPAEAGKQQFSIKSPTATASVRGTGFEFDGINLIVYHGTVGFYNPFAQFRLVGQGEYSYIDEDNVVIMPVAVPEGLGLESIESLEDRSLQENGGRESDLAPPGGDFSTATIVINVE